MLLGVGGGCAEEVVDGEYYVGYIDCAVGVGVAELVVAFTGEVDDKGLGVGAADGDGGWVCALCW